MMGEHGLAEDRAELEYLYKVKSMEKEGWRKTLLALRLTTKGRSSEVLTLYVKFCTQSNLTPSSIR